MRVEVLVVEDWARFRCEVSSILCMAVLVLTGVYFKNV